MVWLALLFVCGIVMMAIGLFIHALRLRDQRLSDVEARLIMLEHDNEYAKALLYSMGAPVPYSWLPRNMRGMRRAPIGDMALEQAKDIIIDIRDRRGRE